MRRQTDTGDAAPPSVRELAIAVLRPAASHQK
jgi:hypothetical protein